MKSLLTAVKRGFDRYYLGSFIKLRLPFWVGSFLLAGFVASLVSFLETFAVHRRFVEGWLDVNFAI